MADLTGTNAEFIYSYTDNFTGALQYDLVLAAFGTSGTNIVSLAITAAAIGAVTADAAYYAHVTDNQTGAQAFATTFDVGYSTTAATSSTYTKSPTAVTSGAGGPAETSEGYGALELGGVFLNAVGDAVTFKGIDNTLVLDSPTAATTIPLSGFNQAGDQIVLNGIVDLNAAILGYGNGVLTVRDNGTTYSLNVAGGTSAANFALASGAAIEGGNASAYATDLVIDYVPCFLRGTMIATPAGEVAVEALRPGDMVVALEDGGPVARPVTWVGGSLMRVDEQADPDAAYPVRIVRHAFAMNVPHRDLLVTPEHCILTEAGLVPARMLVNGASVLIDRSLDAYEYHHVELERHGILLSEGLSTESYLGGDNRATFGVWTGSGPAETGVRAAIAAPLAVARDAVEPIWGRLAERARSLGLVAAPPTPPVTDQPDLRLLLEDGCLLDACWRDGQRHMFHVPRGARPIRLVSRAAVPAEAVGPFVDDRRRLGVAVEKLVLWSGLREQVLPAGGLAMSGWHGSEGGVRWTDGNAALDLPHAGDETFLDVHVAATMLYRDDLRLAA